jgi:hypothetical protein
MQFAIRIEIHDREYKLLHERAEAASFTRTVIDSSTGKRVHLPIGQYVTEAYPTAHTVLLTAMTVALMVDFRAEIIVSGGGEVLTYGCREVEENPFENFFELLAKSHTVPAVPVGLHEYFLGQSGKDTIPTLGAVPESADLTPFWGSLRSSK